MENDLPAELREYNQRARTDVWNYVGAVLTFAAIAWCISLVWQAIRTEKAESIGSALFGAALLLLAMLILGYNIHGGLTRGLWPLIANLSYGSRIDVGHGDLVWWYGSERHENNRIPLEQIYTIKHVINSEMDSMTLLDAADKEIEFNDRCVADNTRWSDAMVRIFPHIRLQRS